MYVVRVNACSLSVPSIAATWDYWATGGSSSVVNGVISGGVVHVPWVSAARLASVRSTQGDAFRVQAEERQGSLSFFGSTRH